MLRIRPISDLRNHFTDVQRQISDDEPVIFTSNGKASMVTMSFDKFSKLTHLDYIERALDAADAYANNNQETLTHQEVFLEIRRKLNG